VEQVLGPVLNIVHLVIAGWLTDQDGTTRVAFEPVELIAKLAALVPRPRADLTRFHDMSACAVVALVITTTTARGYAEGIRSHGGKPAICA